MGSNSIDFVPEMAYGPVHFGFGPPKTLTLHNTTTIHQADPEIGLD